MANISSWLTTIKNAVYGKDMRSAIHDSIEAVNNDIEAKEPKIDPGSTSQYWKGNKTWSDFASSVKSSTLSGLSTATNAVISASDTVLSALGKLQAQITARLKLTGGTMTGNISMGNYKITSTRVPSTSSDYTNKKYVDEQNAKKEDICPVFAGLINRWNGDGDWRIYIQGNLEISPQTSPKFAIDIGYNDAIGYKERLNSFLYLLWRSDGDETLAPDKKITLYKKDSNGFEQLRVRDFVAEYNRYYFEYDANTERYVCSNPQSASLTSSYGLSLVRNTLTNSSYIPGEALSAYQGKVLKDMIDDCANDVEFLLDKTLGSQPKTWKDVQKIVRRGEASRYFNIGDQFIVEKFAGATAAKESTGITNVTVNGDMFNQSMGEVRAGDYVFTFDNKSWHDENNQIVKLADYGITVTGIPKMGDTVTVTEMTEELVFDVIGIDHDTPADEKYTYSMTLQTHNVLEHSMAFDPSDAVFLVDEETYPDGLAAGTYTLSWGSTYYTFTTTHTIPVGGQITDSGIGGYGTLKTFASIKSISELETVTCKYENKNNYTGTYIGAFPLPNTYPYGSNQWKDSDIRDWINSDGEAGAWWQPSNPYDRPGVMIEHDGFLKNMDPAFLDVIGKVTKATAKTIALTDIYTTDDLFFLLSMGEVNISGYSQEGSPYMYYRENNKIKYDDNGKESSWFLRTVRNSSNNSIVTNMGFDSGSGPFMKNRISPACVII